MYLCKSFVFIFISCIIVGHDCEKGSQGKKLKKQCEISNKIIEDLKNSTKYYRKEFFETKFFQEKVSYFEINFLHFSKYIW